MNERPDQVVPDRALDDPIDLTDLLPNDFIAFVQTHQVTMTRYAYQHLGSLEDAEGAVADVMVTLFEQWDDLLRNPAPPIRLAFHLLTRRIENHPAPPVPTPRPADLRPSDPFANPERPDFAEFARAQQPALTRYARQRLRSSHDADDVVSEAMLSLYTRWNSLDHTNPPRALAFRVLQGKIVDWRRRRYIRSEVYVDYTAPDAPDVEAIGHALGDPAAFVPERTTLEDIVVGAIAAMPSKRAACARLHLVMQIPVPDVADYLGVTISTVRSHVHTARRQLAAVLDASVALDSARPLPPRGMTA
ncbi:RNA polymerase sigma factor [Embleya sp. NPDC127516]|uniref:RNA polymerase sigma factor n=1 Tax=Embleya sp. NPDC127516 TaxID=3363990 RepID=UPI0037FE0DD4